jgi:four helix bundle protein
MPEEKPQQGTGGLPHERLKVYQLAEELATLMFTIAQRVPPAQHDLRTHTERTAGSITANTAEGALELSPGKKAQYYRIARASAGELHAHVLSLRRLNFASREEVLAAATLIDRISAMLYRLIQRFGG